MYKPKTAIGSKLSYVLSTLPSLQSSIRYYDDFEDMYRSITDLSNSDQWKVKADGTSITINFELVDVELRPLIKHIAVDLLSRRDPLSSADICNSILKKPKHIFDAATLSPSEFRDIWISEVRPNSTPGYTQKLRSAVHSLCNLSIGNWIPDLNPYVGQLESPPIDLYRTVRTGECFIPLAHQSLLIEYIDTLNGAVEFSASDQSSKELRDTCILIISHQYGFRPGQIARIKLSDVRHFETGAIHISVPLMKQRGTESMRLVVRRIKREWSPIFVEYMKRRNEMPAQKGFHRDSFFNLTPQGLSQVVRDTTAKITGTAWTSMDLRHSAAQRQADAGISHISLSEFMGHATTLTANVYFDASPNQAQRINQALSISPIYSQVAEIARTKFIDKSDLLRLDPDMQIGGVPHGIPIAGIGGCQSGQSLCTKNPVLSCYTCRKFLPISDPYIHQEVVTSLRPIVTEFARASIDDKENPAYTQLRRMFEAALRTANDASMSHEAKDDTQS